MAEVTISVGIYGHWLVPELVFSSIDKLIVPIRTNGSGNNINGYVRSLASEVNCSSYHQLANKPRRRISTLMRCRGLTTKRDSSGSYTPARDKEKVRGAAQWYLVL